MKTLHIILLAGLMALFTGCSKTEKPQASGPSSVEDLAKIIRTSYDQTNSDLLLSQIYTNGMSPEIWSAFSDMFKSFWGKGGLTITDIKTYKFSDYHPDADLPGEIAGRRLEWVAPPSHWIVLKAELLKKKDANMSANQKFDMAAFEKDKRWYLVGAKYAK